MSADTSSGSAHAPPVLVGGCECGAVRYRVLDAFVWAANCHCSRCRAATGSAFKAFARIERDRFELTEGGDALLVVGEPTSNDTRCATCGSLLFSVVDEGAHVHVALGSLVDAPSIRPSEHIFVGSKAPWFEITDDLPRFEEYPARKGDGETSDAVPLSLRRVGAITLFVEDLERARRFYADVFGLAVAFSDDDSTAFTFENTILNLLRAPAARELVEPAAVGGPDAGARLQLTVWVDDVDEACAELRARGVTLLNGPTDRPWGQRTAALADPAGHVWEIAQDLSASDGT